MRFFLLLSWALSSLISVVVAHDYDFGVDMVALTRRQDPNSPIVVGRLPFASNGSIPLRPELREMKADKYKWDLFILALSMFQSVSQDDPLSYYQIAGIHGVPFVTWNGVGPAQGASQSGYCAHSSVLFPTWHRPYLALYEQELYKLTNAIARMYSNATERQLYQQAALNFRIPYWDWASPAPSGENHFPDVFWTPLLTQYGPNGVQVIRNPLYSYSFHPLDEEAFIWDPLKQWNETKRAPNTSISIQSPPSMNDRVNTALLSKLPEIQQRLYILFSSYHEFNSFSNKAWAVSQNLSNLDSIEAIHDIIHIYGGSRGHMTYVPLSAFDPLFFLHHAMIDRLIAMWQLLNPSAWISPMASGETTYTAPKGTIQNSSTPLTPFLSSSDGKFWDSDMSRTTEVFGYAYADTATTFGDGQNPRTKLIKKINNWLGGSSPIGLRSKERFQEWRPQEIGQAWKGNFDSKTFKPNIKIDAKDPPVSAIIKNNLYTEWMANVHVNHRALDGPFTVHFFIGEPPDGNQEWDGATNLAGSVGIFAMDMRGTAISHSKISGAVPLTTALMKLVATRVIPGLAPESVVSFLQKTLQFRVVDVDGRALNPELMAGLYIGISSTEVLVPEGDLELPKWGEPVARFTMWE